MNGEVVELMLRTAQEHGVLPLTSACNVSCLFCSNRQNPPGIRTFDISTLSLEQVDELLAYLIPREKIIIGESATRINEGEPLLHPDFPEILKRVRSRFPGTLIQITTNGSLLTEKLAELLESMHPVEIYLSLNSGSEEMRMMLMNDKSGSIAVRSPIVLKGHNIPFHGSLVAQPSVLGWDDMERTIQLLAGHGARTIRIFMPGYTRWYRGNQESVSREHLFEYARKMTKKYSLPVLSEPHALKDLEAVVEGVVVGSPASAVMLQPGDIIESVDNMPVWSRNHAFNLIKAAAAPDLVYRRKNCTYRIRLSKEKNEFSGLVFYDDMSLQRMLHVKGRLEGCRELSVLILTSELAVEVVAAACNSLLRDFSFLHIVPVPSLFWGGTIAAAGLLTVGDFIAAADSCKHHFDLVFLPYEPFDHQGRDLTGRSYREISDAVGREVILV